MLEEWGWFELLLLCQRMNVDVARGRSLDVSHSNYV